VSLRKLNSKETDSISREKKNIAHKIRSEFSFVEGNFRIMLLSWFVLDLFSELPLTYYPLYVLELGGTAAILGLIGAVESLSRAFVQIPGGYLADKYGRKWLITSMTLISGLSRIFYVLAPSWEWIMVGAVIIGFSNIYLPALNAIVADSVPSDKRGMGYTLINLIASVSTTPAPLLAGYLFIRMGLMPSVRLSYVLVIIGFMTAAFFRFRLKETVENPEKLNVMEIFRSYPVSLKESIEVWNKVPRSAFILFIVNIITGFMVGLFQPIFTVWIIKDIGIGEVSFSYIMATMFITMIIFAIPSGKLIDKIGKKKPMLFAFILWAIAIPLTIYGNFWRLIISMTLVGLLQVMIHGSTAALTADLVPSEHRGKTSGSRGFFSMISSSFGMLTSGWLYDNVGHVVPWYLEFVLIIIPFTLVYLYVKEPDKN
jgi:MFS family permease